MLMATFFLERIEGRGEKVDRASGAREGLETVNSVTLADPAAVHDAEREVTFEEMHCAVSECWCARARVV